MAQETRRPRRVGARGRHEGPEVQSGPSPSVPSAYAIPRDREEAVDGDAPMDAQNAPTAAWKSRFAFAFPGGFAAVPGSLLTRHLPLCLCQKRVYFIVYLIFEPGNDLSLLTAFSKLLYLGLVDLETSIDYTTYIIEFV